MSDSVAEHIAALKDHDWGIREESALALGECGDPRGVSPLIEMLKDSDRAVREAATSSLTTIGEPAVLPLGTCLQDPNFTIQEMAASILAAIGDNRVIDPLIGALLSPDWIVRMYAARALARIRAPEAVETLVLLLQDTVKAVREEAASAIVALGEKSIPSLLKALDNPDWRVRLRVVEAMGMVKLPFAIEPLLSLLSHDPDTAVRQDAARALGEIGDRRAVPGLLTALDQTKIRTPVIEALGNIGDPQAIPALVTIINGLMTADYEGRLSACQDDRYKQDLVPIETAVKALASIGDVCVIPTLLKALRSTLLRAEAAEALAILGQPAIPHLLTILKTDHDENIHYHVRETLSRIGWRPGRIKL